MKLRMLRIVGLRSNVAICRALMALQGEIHVHNELDLWKIKLKQAKALAQMVPTAENRHNYYELLSHPPPGLSPACLLVQSNTDDKTMTRPANKDKDDDDC